MPYLGLELGGVFVEQLHGLEPLRGLLLRVDQHVRAAFRVREIASSSGRRPTRRDRDSRRIRSGSDGELLFQLLGALTGSQQRFRLFKHWKCSHEIDSLLRQDRGISASSDLPEDRTLVRTAQKYLG